MHRTSIAIVLLAMVALSANGCAYAERRWHDLTQITRANVGIGVGLAAHANITEYGHLGLGFCISRGVGWEPDHGGIINQVEVGAIDKMHFYADGLAFGICDRNRGRNLFYNSDADYGFDEIGVDFHLLIVGAEFAVLPIETLDFVLGFFTIDILADDYGGFSSAESIELLAAIRSGNLGEVKALIEETPELAFEKGRWGLTKEPMYVAIRTGDVAIVESLLSVAKDPRVDFPKGLIGACLQGKADVVRALIAAGYDPDVTIEGAVPPLLAATGGWHTEVVRVLLEHGADPNVKSAYLDITPLHVAADRGSVKMARLLLEHGADIHARTSEGMEPLRYATAKSEPDQELVDLLKEYGGTDQTGDPRNTSGAYYSERSVWPR